MTKALIGYARCSTDKQDLAARGVTLALGQSRYNPADGLPHAHSSHSMTFPHTAQKDPHRLSTPAIRAVRESRLYRMSRHVQHPTLSTQQVNRYPAMSRHRCRS